MLTTKKKPQPKTPTASWRLSLVGGGFVQKELGANRKVEIYLHCDTAEPSKCESFSYDSVKKDFEDSHPEVAKRRNLTENLQTIQNRIRELNASIESLTSNMADNAEIAKLMTEVESMKKLEESNRIAIEKCTEQLTTAATVFLANRRQKELEKAVEARNAARKAFEDAIEHMPELTAFSDAIAMTNHARNGLLPSPESLF